METDEMKTKTKLDAKQEWHQIRFPDKYSKFMPIKCENCDCVLHPCGHSFYGHNGTCLAIGCGCQIYSESHKEGVI